MATIVSKDYSKKLLKLISWSHWFTFFNIAIAIICSVIYVISEPLPESLLGQVYLFANWFSHMAFITFLAFLLIVFPDHLIVAIYSVYQRQCLCCIHHFCDVTGARWLYIQPTRLSHQWLINRTNPSCY